MALTVSIVAAFVLAPSIQGASAHPDGMAGHMTMTALRPIQPGDQARADAIVAAARKAADRYVDYRKALADGYKIFLPNVKQDVYHFTNGAQAIRNNRLFDAANPTSLLYEKVASSGSEGPTYKLVGVMYTAPYGASEDELNRRVPLSIAQWHLHSNFCLPPSGRWSDAIGPNARFGMQGSITTAEACSAAGGRFVPHVFGWMVHVYPYETDPGKVWSAGMDDTHGMQHDTMPMDMKME